MFLKTIITLILPCAATADDRQFRGVDAVFDHPTRLLPETAVIASTESIMNMEWSYTGQRPWPDFPAYVDKAPALGECENRARNKVKETHPQAFVFGFNVSNVEPTFTSSKEGGWFRKSSWQVKGTADCSYKYLK
jgi:hypothetical protein